MFEELINFVSEKVEQKDFPFVIKEEESTIIFKSKSKSSPRTSSRTTNYLGKSHDFSKTHNLITFRLNKSYEDFILNYKNYYIVKTNLTDSFLESFLNIVKKDFRILEISEKKKEINNFRKHLASKLDEFRSANKLLSKKFGKKGILQRDLLNFNKSLNDNLNAINFICNFYDMNIYIFHMNRGEIENKTLYFSEFKKIDKHKPTIFIQQNKNLYSPIFNDKFQVYTYSDKFDDVLEKLSEDFTWKKPDNKLKKLKVAELRQLAEDLGLSIKKESEKTKKLINKTKTELILDITKVDYDEMIKNI